jgi:hypothetical protein
MGQASERGELPGAAKALMLEMRPEMSRTGRAECRSERMDYLP